MATTQKVGCYGAGHKKGVKIISGTLGGAMYSGLSS